MNKTEFISVRIEPTFKKQLKKLAKKRGVRISTLVVELLNSSVK